MSRCECFRVFGGECHVDRVAYPPSYIVEWMPPALRASHTDARNAGVYPHNGAVRLVVTPVCVDHIVEASDGWAHEVDGVS